MGRPLFWRAQAGDTGADADRDQRHGFHPDMNAAIDARPQRDFAVESSIVQSAGMRPSRKLDASVLSRLRLFAVAASAAIGHWEPAFQASSPKTLRAGLLGPAPFFLDINQL